MKHSGSPGLDNSIQPWHIASDGSVTNGFA